MIWPHWNQGWQVSATAVSAVRQKYFLPVPAEILSALISAIMAEIPLKLRLREMSQIHENVT